MNNITPSIPGAGGDAAPAKNEESLCEECSSDPLEQKESCAEIVFAFVAPLGSDLYLVENAIAGRLEVLGYEVSRIRVTDDVLPKLDPDTPVLSRSAYERFGKMMDVGTDSRGEFGKAIVADGIASEIARRRPKGACRPKTAYIVHSLKHPDEVRRLREIYPRGFYLVAMNVPPDVRRKHLITKYEFTEPQAEELMQRDKKESVPHGQQVNATFHLADFFVGWADDPERIKNSVYRFVDIVFGDPHRTPTFGEYAMYLAFAASLRSADLSRQVGAVIARGGEILSTGANDCPQLGGGLYWPRYDELTKAFGDEPKGRDYTRGEDSNKKAQLEIVREISEGCAQLTHGGKLCIPPEYLRKIEEVVERSAIGNLTEFGRVVHAEMEALLSCARKGVSTLGATVYTTTFPCHNCAKHIIAAGIERVVFIEPYLKSQASNLHDEIIEVTYPKPKGERKPGILPFETFFGVGPRRFLDLFSMNLGGGREIVRKDRETGATAEWTDKTPRIKMNLSTYLEEELNSTKTFKDAVQTRGRS